MEETSIQPSNRGLLPTVEVNNRMKADEQPWANDVTSEPDSDSDEDVSGLVPQISIACIDLSS